MGKKTAKNFTIYHHAAMSMMINESCLTEIKMSFYLW